MLKHSLSSEKKPFITWMSMDSAWLHLRLSTTHLGMSRICSFGGAYILHYETSQENSLQIKIIFKCPQLERAGLKELFNRIHYQCFISSLTRIFPFLFVSHQPRLGIVDEISIRRPAGKGLHGQSNRF